MFSGRRRPYLLKSGKSSQCWRDSNRESSQGCRQHFAVGLWTARAQSQSSLLPHHLSDTRVLYAAVQADCDLFWSTELKEFFRSQITYLWAFFSFVYEMQERNQNVSWADKPQRYVKWGGESGNGQSICGLVTWKNSSAVKHTGFIKSQAKRHTGGVLSSHFINHYKHWAVGPIAKLCKRGTHTTASGMHRSQGLWMLDLSQC